MTAFAEAGPSGVRHMKGGLFSFASWPLDPKRDFYQSRPTRSREVLAKCGIQLPKPKPRLPHTFEIGIWRRDGREVRLDRAALFDRVWSEPVEKLAKERGLSGRGLTKACRRLQIPVPPRGFWERIQHGQKMRSPRLAELQPGEAEVIVIRRAAMTPLPSYPDCFI